MNGQKLQALFIDLWESVDLKHDECLQTIAQLEIFIADYNDLKKQFDGLEVC